MNNPLRKPNFFHSISKTIHDLFIGERDSSYIYWILGLITLIGMAMRLWKINDPIAYDEAYTFIYFATKPFRQILSDYSAPNNHILHTILVSLAYRLFGGHTWIVRFPAFVAGTLCIPAAYFASRRIFNGGQSLAAAALVAWTPWFINYSTNGRGYTLLTLFALLLANFAGIIVRQQSRAALIAYGITAALGFYTIPIFLYPMAGVSLWVLATYLTANESWNNKSRKIWFFLTVCVLAGMLTLLLYSPVILFGTGARSIFNNDIVEPRDWTFVENIAPRLDKTWASWMQFISPPIRYLLLGGFLLSLFFYRKASRQRLPLQIFLILSILILLVIQRVAPLPRVWFYLEAFYMVFAGAGLVWFVEILIRQISITRSKEKIIPTIILLILVSVSISNYVSTHQASVIGDQNDVPEKYAAEYLTSHLKKEDTILSIAPVDILTAYYLYINNISYDVFYQRDHPVQIQNALIVLRTNSRYNTPESVLDFYKLTTSFDLQTVQLIYEYGPVSIFSIPAR